jgi:hypothetical protein
MRHSSDQVHATRPVDEQAQTSVIGSMALGERKIDIAVYSNSTLPLPRIGMQEEVQQYA